MLLKFSIKGPPGPACPETHRGGAGPKSIGLLLKFGPYWPPKLGIWQAQAQAQSKGRGWTGFELELGLLRGQVGFIKAFPPTYGTSKGTKMSNKVIILIH